MGKNSKVAAQRPWRMKRVAASVRSALSDRRSRWKAALVLPATLAALPVATGAHALNLGEIEPLSAIGQPFRARVALYRGAEESLQSACVSMRASRLEGNAHVPIGLPAQARLESRGAREYLFIESGEMLSEPVVQLRIEVRCPASEGVSREYLVLQDPPDPLADTTPVHPHPAASPSTPAPAPADTWERPQDGPATRPATAPRASAIARASAPAPEARRTAAPRP
ncbi:MAG: hypothetical protein IT514_04195, partial [Burkholderiales bacterium]|nr:hypothetical protein [Burkholderiales bacterium]